MEFDLGHDASLLRLFPEVITVITSDNVSRSSQRNRGPLETVINEMGRLSAKAQGLGAVITTIHKLMHTDQRIYVHRTDRAVNGILKVGKKKLFIRESSTGRMHEIEPLCVLDFYVHESVQRGGIGKEVFEHMLMAENVNPAMLGYDRPSPKLLGFLRKHYGLSEFDPQANNFVVFRCYFRSALPLRGIGRDQLVSQRPLTASRGRRANGPARDQDQPEAIGACSRADYEPPSANSGRAVLSSAPSSLQSNGNADRLRVGLLSADAQENDTLSAFASRHAVGGNPHTSHTSSDNSYGHEPGRFEKDDWRRPVGGAGFQDQATTAFLQSRSTPRTRRPFLSAPKGQQLIEAIGRLLGAGGDNGVGHPPGAAVGLAAARARGMSPVSSTAHNIFGTNPSPVFAIGQNGVTGGYHSRAHAATGNIPNPSAHQAVVGDFSAGAEARLREAQAAADRAALGGVGGGAGRYNPYEQFAGRARPDCGAGGRTDVEAAGQYHGLANAARLERAPGHRLW